jgi:V8-like Glu-specific endopeptidase
MGQHRPQLACRTAFPVCIAGIFCVVVSSFVCAQQPISLGDVLETNITASLDPPGAGDDLKFSKTINSSVLPSLAGTSFVQVHFSAIDCRDVDTLAVKIFNGAHQEIQSFNKESFNSRESFWSKRLAGEVVAIEVAASSAHSTLKFKIDKVAFSHREVVKYSIVHTPSELEAIRAYAGISAIEHISNPVGRLTFFANGHLEACSGFLIDDNRFLTNYHCIDSDDVCVAGARVDFGYQEEPNGRINDGESYDCIELVDKASELDAALIRLSGNPGKKWGHLNLSDRSIAQDEQAYLIQHPGGDPKQIARKECYISTLSAEWETRDVDIGHMCDTAKGSSGSPLIGKDFNVVGLHHRGFDDDGRWKAENRAVKIDKVIQKMHLPVTSNK